MLDEKFSATTRTGTPLTDSVLYFLCLEGLPRLFFIYILSVLYYRFPEELTSQLSGCLFILHERDLNQAEHCSAESAVCVQVTFDERCTSFAFYFISL
jgi:hypothetical protein